MLAIYGLHLEMIIFTRNNLLKIGMNLKHVLLRREHEQTNWNFLSSNGVHVNTPKNKLFWNCGIVFEKPEFFVKYRRRPCLDTYFEKPGNQSHTHNETLKCITDELRMVLIDMIDPIFKSQFKLCLSSRIWQFENFAFYVAKSWVHLNCLWKGSIWHK